MAARFRRNKMRTSRISDPIRVAFILVYITPASVALGPPECDIERLRSFFYKVCELITVDANFVDATDILNDMKLALKSHVDYYRQEEYKDFQRILSEIETVILPAIQAQTDTFDVADLQADIGYIQMIMKEIYTPPSQEGDQLTSEYTRGSGSVHPSDHTRGSSSVHPSDHTRGSSSVHPSDHMSDRNSEFNSDRLSEHISEQFTDHTSDRSSERNSEPYTHKSSRRVSRMIRNLLQSIVRSIPYSDIIRYTNTLITYIETTYYANEGLERIQDKLISMIGNINHGISPAILKMRVEYIKTALENCTQG